MTFDRLPDPERYSHPRLSWLIERGFRLVTRAMYRRECISAHDGPLPPCALIVSNHQRDSDGPILATFLYRCRGTRILDPLPHFAMREDLFQPGALGVLLARWPRPLKWLLGGIPLAWLFRNVRTWPMRRIGEFSWGETVQALIEAGHGTADPATLFNARGRRELAAQLGGLPSQLAGITPLRLGPLRCARWGLRRLRLSVLRQLAPMFRQTINAQLDRFAALLDAGERVYFSPEGCVSPDGAFGRVRYGAWQICQRSQADVPVLPCTISYDALAPGRLRAVVRIGRPMRDLRGLERSVFETRLRRAILAQYPVTASHLLAWFLCEGPETFTTPRLADWLQQARASAKDAGLELDPLLEQAGSHALAEQRLRWLRRRRLVLRSGSRWHNAWPADAAPGWHHPAAVVRYLANSLDDLSPPFSRTLRS